MPQRKRRLTQEQEELRLQGLRLLARLIVRAHLASLREQEERDGARAASGGLIRNREGGRDE